MRLVGFFCEYCYIVVDPDSEDVVCQGANRPGNEEEEPIARARGVSLEEVAVRCWDSLKAACRDFDAENLDTYYSCEMFEAAARRYEIPLGGN